MPDDVWHVYPFPIGVMQHDGWMVIRENARGLADRATRKFDDADNPLTKQEAIDVGTDIAEHNAPAQLVIHGAPVEGKQGNLIYPIDDERTFDREDDPHPPAG